MLAVAVVGRGVFAHTVLISLGLAVIACDWLVAFCFLTTLRKVEEDRFFARAKRRSLEARVGSEAWKGEGLAEKAGRGGKQGVEEMAGRSSS